MKKAKLNNGEWGVALFVLCAAAFVLAHLGGGSDDHDPGSQTAKPQVVAAGQFAVYDGDTVRWPGLTPLSLAQIDAPAREGCLGQAATVRLAELIGTGGDLRVVYDSRLPASREGRAQAYLDKNGEDLGVALVREGLARVAWHGVRGDRAAQLQAAQRQARADKAGIWARCDGR